MVRARTKSFDSLLSDVRQIIKEGMQKAYQGVDAVMVHTYWLIGKRIVEDEQNGEARAKFGAKLLDNLAEELSHEYATSYSNVYGCPTCVIEPYQNAIYATNIDGVLLMYAI